MTMRIVIAGGGTGGHLYPGIALAEEFMTRHNENEVLFIGTQRGIEKDAVPRAGFKIEFIEASGLKRVGFLAFVKSLFSVPRAVAQSWKILKQFKPGIVIAVGGYVSGPVALAAWLRRIPVVVQEQNALPGLTSRSAGRFARHVFVAFEEAGRFFKASKVILTGNPIRQSLMENFLRPRPHRDRERPKILVFGGSQGAKSLNEAMVLAAPLLVEKFSGLRILHQTGSSSIDQVRAAYEAAGVSEHVELTPFIHDMSAAYGESLAVVCRAGATTIAELTICQRAAVLIPFPFAADDHQTINAKALTDAGAALLLPEQELSAESLTNAVSHILGDHEQRVEMEKRAGLLGHPQAAKEIADTCVELWMVTGGFEREQRALVAKEKSGVGGGGR